MKFDELATFIEERMSMSHVYQPLVIRSLVDADGAATLRGARLWPARGTGRPPNGSRHTFNPSLKGPRRGRGGPRTSDRVRPRS